MKIFKKIPLPHGIVRIVMIAFFAITGSVSSVMADDIDVMRLPDEELHYRVLYKWGLIQKQAGKATLTLRGNDRQYVATLVGRSLPWADKIYKLRDTLQSTIDVKTLLPSKYERIAHEKGKYAHDVVEITNVDNLFIGKATRQRRGSEKNAQMKYAASELKAVGPTVDLLSAFYYLRALNFSKFKPGHAVSLNIFSGKQKELLKITYMGQERIKIEDQYHVAYHVVFTFTSDGGKKSSSNINAWISADRRRIPLRLEGSLPIGKIQCIYDPNP